MKQWLAYVFLIIFSFQVLPVKELGKMLFKGQLTEEIHEVESQPNDNKSSKLKKGSDPFYRQFSHETGVTAIKYFSSITDVAIQQAERLPLSFVPDIFTPPPNRA